MTLALKKYILQEEIIQFPSNEGITDMELSVLCTWAFPLRGHLVYILSFRESTIKYTMNIWAKKVFCNVKKKEKMAKKKSSATCCCVLRRKPPICAERPSSEATKETCSRTPVSWREQFVRSILSALLTAAAVMCKWTEKAQDPIAVHIDPQCASECDAILKIWWSPKMTQCDCVPWKGSLKIRRISVLYLLTAKLYHLLIKENMQKRIYHSAEYSPQLALQHKHKVCDPSRQSHRGPQNKFISSEDSPNLNSLCIFLYNYAKECTEPLAVQFTYLPKPSGNWHALLKKLSLWICFTVTLSPLEN